MTTVGVTGGIGSGKSAFVARLGAHEGTRVILADALAKQLMAEDEAVGANRLALVRSVAALPHGFVDFSLLPGF